MLGIAAIAAQPVSPPISLGGTLSLAVAWPNAESSTFGAAPTQVALGVVHVASNYLQTANELVARFTAVALSVCPPLGLGGRVELQSCGRATAGWLWANDRAIANPTPVGRTWFGLGALLRLAVPIGGGLALEATAGVDFPLVKRRFIITSPDITTVGETPPAAGWAGLGLGLSL
jgi:hypothetical protein